VIGRELTGDDLRPPVFRQHHYLGVAVFIVATFIAAPLLFSSPANDYLVNLWLAYTIAAIGFYFVFGLGGRFAFCQTFMMAMGGYTSAWITRELGAQYFLLGLVGAMAACALLALLIGAATARAQEFYFAIATLAVTEIGTVVFQQGGSFFGPNGTIDNISIPNIGGHEILSDKGIFRLFLIILALVLFLAAWIERSPLRRNAIAGRQQGLVANTLGVPVIQLQLTLFMLGSAMGGLSGALIGHWNGVTEANSFGITLSIGLFLMLLLGGLTSMWGPVIGAAFYVAIPQVLTSLSQYQTIVYGTILLVVVILVPNGLVDLIRRGTAWVVGRSGFGSEGPGSVLGTFPRRRHV
jgi:branched-chain amino acid transport system permease protein